MRQRLSLFVERAKDVAVEVDPADPLVASIVAQLDGITLGFGDGHPQAGNDEHR